MKSKKLQVLIVRLLSVFSILVLYYTQKNNSTHIVYINNMLLILALIDFGYQQASIMRMPKKEWVLMELLIVSSVLVFIRMIYDQKTILIELIFIGYTINSLSGLVNQKTKIHEMILIVFIRFIAVAAFLNTESKFVIAACLILFGIYYKYSRNVNLIKNIFEYLTKRVQFGMLAIGAILTEQIVRVDGDIGYSESILILIVGYIVGFASVIQSVIIQSFFSENRNTLQVKSNEYAIYGSVLISNLLIYISCLLLDIDDFRFMMMCFVTVTSNLYLRIVITRKSLNNKNMYELVFLSIICLLLVVYMFWINRDPVEIQLTLGLVSIFYLSLLSFKGKLKS